MAITRKLAKWISNYNNPNSIGSKFRAKRSKILCSLIKKIFQQHGFVNIIDIGGTENYWNIIPQEYLEKHKVSITLLNLENATDNTENSLFIHVIGNGCDLTDFEDNSFHIAHSNSVIEHVGDWKRMKLFAKEIQRVSQNYFVQTPNYWFPIEPHCMTPFFQWLPKPMRIWLVSKFQLGHWAKANSIDEAVEITESARLLNKKMFQELFPKTSIISERFLFMTKSFIAIKVKY